MTYVWGSLITALATLGGVVITRLFDRQTRRAAEEERRETRRASHDGWLRERRADAYVNILAYMTEAVTYVGAHVFAVEHLGGNFAHIQPVVATHEGALTLGRLNAYGHQSIVEMAEAWDRINHQEMALTAALRANPTDAEVLAKLKVLQATDQEAFDQMVVAISGDLSTPASNW